MTTIMIKLKNLIFNKCLIPLYLFVIQISDNRINSEYANQFPPKKNHSIKTLISPKLNYYR